jgi:hypothetical protein
MEAAAHGWHKPGGGGPSKAVGQEFVAADEQKKSHAKTLAKALKR